MQLNLELRGAILLEEAQGFGPARVAGSDRSDVTAGG
jgi:hypothetical protein